MIARIFVAMCGLVAIVAPCSYASAQQSNGDLVLRYHATDGNMTLVFTGTGSSGAGPIHLQMLNVLTLGDGNTPSLYGPLMPTGIPNVSPGRGGLNGSRANLPAATIQTFNSGAGATAGLNGIYSEIYNASLGSSWITFASSGTTTLDLGTVAAASWSQANLDAIFVTNADASPDGGLNYGHFLYAELGGTAKLGRVELAVVPEPASLLAISALPAALIMVLHRRCFVRP